MGCGAKERQEVMFRFLYVHLAFNILAAALHLYHLISKYEAIKDMGNLSQHMIFVAIFHAASILSTIIYLSIREYQDIRGIKTK